MIAIATFPDRRAEDQRPSGAAFTRRNLGHIVSMVAHAALFACLAVTTQDVVSPVDSLTLDMMPQGDTMQSEDAPEAEVSPTQPKEVRQPDPDAPPRPIEKEGENRVKQVEQRRNAARADRRQQASVRHTLGVEGGRAKTMSRASYMGLLAAAIARHVPSVSVLGPGTAVCYFTVTSTGSISGVSCSGTTPAQAALLRAAIAAARTPGPPPGGGFHTRQPAYFH